MPGQWRRGCAQGLLHLTAPDWRRAVQDSLERWDKRFIVASNDVDGLLSAAYLAAKYGAILAGFYTTKDVILVDDHSAADTRSALWADLDVDHAEVISIGQHLLLHDEHDTLAARNHHGFNPNVFFRQACFASGRPSSFQGRADRTRDKYPFATIHLLLEAMTEDVAPLGPLAVPLLVHADSAWTNVPTYPTNCRLWADIMFERPTSVVRQWVLRYTGFPSAVARQRDLIERLRPLTSTTSASAVTPSLGRKWLGLNGHQTVPPDERFIERTARLLELIEEELGWHLEAPARVSRVIAGNKGPIDPARIPCGLFDDWLATNAVFSHAFTSLRRLLYTVDLELSD